MLPAPLKQRAQRLARRLGISFGELVREALEATLRGHEGEVREDPLYGDDAVFGGEAPADLADRHDDYLYDEKA